MLKTVLAAVTPSATAVDAVEPHPDPTGCVDLLHHSGFAGGGRSATRIALRAEAFARA
jgi:hypothetical protein